MRRGEVRIIQSRVTRRQEHALLVGTDALNEAESEGWAMVAPIDTEGRTDETLVTVPISSPIAGLVRCDNVTSVRKERVADLIGRVDPNQMESVNIALRAALDL